MTVTAAALCLLLLLTAGFSHGVSGDQSSEDGAKAVLSVDEDQGGGGGGSEAKGDTVSEDVDPSSPPGAATGTEDTDSPPYGEPSVGTVTDEPSNATEPTSDTDSQG